VKILMAVLMVMFLAGCAYSTRVQVGEYGASHTLAITKHEFE
jgi:PBP1b-binding outer membrane lipoprotein LpoB